MSKKKDNTLLYVGAAAAALLLFKKKQSVTGISGNRPRLDNYHVLKIKYLGATNNSPSRVKIISERFKDSKTISFNHEYNNITEVAAAYLIDKGYDLVGKAEGSDVDYIITNTFKGLSDH